MKDFIEVYDNILTPEEADSVEKSLIFNEFPWYMQFKTVYDSPKDNRFRESIWMSHGFIDDGVVTSSNVHIPGMLLDRFLKHTNYNLKHMKKNLKHIWV